MPFSIFIDPLWQVVKTVGESIVPANPAISTQHPEVAVFVSLYIKQQFILDREFVLRVMAVYQKVFPVPAVQATLCRDPEKAAAILNDTVDHSLPQAVLLCQTVKTQPVLAMQGNAQQGEHEP